MAGKQKKLEWLKNYPMDDRKLRWITFLFAFLSAFALVAGKAVYTENSLNSLFRPMENFLLFLMKFCLCFMVAYLFYLLLAFWGIKRQKEGLAQEDRKDVEAAKGMPLKQNIALRLVFGVVLFLLDMAVLLIWFPGVFSYDITIQTDEALGYLPFDRFHPPLHTFLWKCCMMLGGGAEKSLKETIENAMTLYGVLQAGVSAYVLSGVMLIICRSNINRYAKIVLMGFQLLNPVYLIFSIIPVKDGIFALFFVQMTVRLFWEMQGGKGRRKQNAYFLAIDLLLCCLFRNNAVYALVPVFFILLAKGAGKAKKPLCAMAAAFLLYFFINGIVFSAMGVGKGDIRESLSLPLQQIAHTYVSENENLSEGTIGQINRFIPVERLNSVFNPRFADYVKEISNKEEIQSSFGDFLKLYFQLMIHNPDNYLNEMLTLNVSSWYPLADGVDPVSKRVYIETILSEYPKAQPERRSFFPKASLWLDGVSDYSAFEGMPIIRNLFSMAAPFWLVVLCLYLFLITGRHRKAVLCMPALFLWATHLLGPVACMRYMYPIALLVPFLLCVALDFGRGRIDKG